MLTSYRICGIRCTLYIHQVWHQTMILNYYLPTFWPQCHGKIWWQAPIQRSSVDAIKEWTSHQSQPLSHFSQQKTLEQWIQEYLGPSTFNMFPNSATTDDKMEASKYHPHSGNNRDISPNCMVDLQKLSASTMREMHHIPSPFNEVSMVREHMRNTLVDSWNGYHSLPLFPT